MRRRDWSIGSAVAVELNDGSRVTGQVWAETNVPNYVWVALSTGKYVAVYTPRGTVKAAPAGEQVGQVAA